MLYVCIDLWNIPLTDSLSVEQLSRARLTLVSQVERCLSAVTSTLAQHSAARRQQQAASRPWSFFGRSQAFQHSSAFRIFRSKALCSPTIAVWCWCTLADCLATPGSCGLPGFNYCVYRFTVGCVWRRNKPWKTAAFHRSQVCNSLWIWSCDLWCQIWVLGGQVEQLVSPELNNRSC